MTTFEASNQSSEKEVAEEQLPEPLSFRALKVMAEAVRYKKTISGTTAVFLMGAILMCFVVRPSYKSTLLMMTPTQLPSLATMVQSAGSLGGAGLLAAASGGGLSLKDPDMMFMGFFETEPLLKGMVTSNHLVDVYKCHSVGEAENLLFRHTKVKEEKSSLISITVRDHDPNRAAQLANGYIDEFRNLTYKLSQDASEGQKKYFETQLGAEREELIKAELNLQTLQQNKGMLSLDGQSTLMLQRLAEARANADMKRVELEALRSYSTENNANVQLAEKQLGALQSEANRLADHGSSQFSDLGAKDIPTAGLDYLRATRNVEFHEAVYLLLMKQYLAMRLDTQRNSYQVQVVQHAIPPMQPWLPIRFILIALALVSGPIAGFFLARLLQHIAELKRRPEYTTAVQELRRAAGGQ
jgi:uncharacterized protein involved in exopolysaccharide biosynthesis